MLVGISISLVGRLRAGVSSFAIAGFTPPLVLDFENEYYQVDRLSTTFDSAITHTRNSNATMVDSDGLLKWAPHNLLRYSEQFDNAAWVKAAATVTANAAVAPDGTTTADKVIATAVAGGHSVYQSNSVALTEGRFAIYAKADGYDNLRIIELASFHYYASFDLSNGTVSATGGTFFVSASATEVGNGWYLCEIVTDKTSIGTPAVMGFPDGSEPTTGPVSYTGDGTSGIYVWGAHAYRSDLGGMVNNPDRGDSYVPTTSAARYLARRGHHVYNGAEWVNEGALFEPTGAVQLLHTTDALVTQSHTVTAEPHTLHFTGTGTVTLSGAYSGSLVGTGTGEENRVSLTFTPTAASLTLTVSGTVSDAQLEVGSVPTSYIPNLAGSGTVTRAADTLTVPSANLPWPTPNVIGPELADLSDASSGNITISNEIVSRQTATASETIDISVAVSELGLSNGDVVKVSGTISNYDAGAGVEGVGWSNFSCFSGLAFADRIFNLGDGSFEKVLVVQDASKPLKLAYLDTTLADISNISVREIDPLAVSIQMEGRMTYADEDDYEVYFHRWFRDINTYVQAALDATSTRVGMPRFFQNDVSYTVAQVAGLDAYSPGINVPFNIASRHGSTFINGAVDGTALTADTTPTALPDLSTTDLSLAYAGGPMILKRVRIWADDLGDSGIAEASA